MLRDEEANLLNFAVLTHPANFNLISGRDLMSILALASSDSFHFLTLLAIFLDYNLGVREDKNQISIRYYSR